MNLFRVLIALTITCAVTNGCTAAIQGAAVKDTSSPVFVEHFTGSRESVVFRDIITELVASWESRGVPLVTVHFEQWDSQKGDAPPACRGSVFPQPAFCSEGWLAWDAAWARRALSNGAHIPIVYSSRAVSDAVAYALGKPYGSDTSSVRTQECLTGAYLALNGSAALRELRGVFTEVGAVVRGMESVDPARECLYA